MTGKSLGFLIPLIAACGCSTLPGPDSTSQLLSLKDPATSRAYWLYRPGAYDRAKDWPLVVVCASTFPQSPERVIQAWTSSAESHGFLILAPTLKATAGLLPEKRDKQLPLLREDESHVMAAVQHACGGHSISEDRVFLFGAGDTAASALAIGLAHPDVFRAVSLSQPRFLDAALGAVGQSIDPYQPIQIHYKVSDPLTGSHGKKYEEWLRQRGARLRDDMMGGANHDPWRPAVAFFEDCIRGAPWIHVRALATESPQPRETRFHLLCSFSPSSYHWDFGDGETSPVAEPVHRFKGPGTYDVAVTVSNGKGESHRRVKRISVP
jgi:hypothetical protein